MSGDEYRICDLETGIWNGNDSTCKREYNYISAGYIHVRRRLSELV